MQLPTPGDFLTQTFLDVRHSVALNIALGKWNLPLPLHPDGTSKGFLYSIQKPQGGVRRKSPKS